MRQLYKFGFVAVALLIFCGGGRAQTAQVPFEFVHNQIIVTTMIDGKGPFNAMIDTGTDPSAVDIARAREIGIKLDTKGHKSSGGGTDVNLSYVCRFTSVAIG